MASEPTVRTQTPVRTKAICAPSYDHAGRMSLGPMLSCVRLSPFTRIFLSVPTEEKASHRESGEKLNPTPSPATSSRTLAPELSTRYTPAFPVDSSRKAMVFPSGDQLARVWTYEDAAERLLRIGRLLAAGGQYRGSEQTRHDKPLREEFESVGLNDVELGSHFPIHWPFSRLQFIPRSIC